MAKPVIAKNETAYCVDASEASRGWVVSQAFVGPSINNPKRDSKAATSCACATATDSGAFARNDRIEYDRHASARTTVSRMAGGAASARHGLSSWV